MRKIVSLLLASVLLLSLAGTASAGARGENHCNKVDPDPGFCGGHGRHA